jgi:hypothetical protein
MDIDPIKLAEFNAASLAHGSHSPDDGVGCAMEWASKLAGEEWSDHPQCVCPNIASAYIRANDRMGHDFRNELLKPIVVLALGTRATLAVEMKRMYMAVDWAVRWAGPRGLRARGREDLALRLEGLAEIVDLATAHTAREVTAEVRYAAAYAAASAASAYAASAYAASAAAYASAYAAYAASAAAYAAAAADAAYAASAAASAAADAASAASAAADAASAAHASSAAADASAAAAGREVWSSYCDMLKRLCAVTAVKVLRG